MLWTDAQFVSSSDLASVDPDVIDAAKALDITLDDVGSTPGILHRAIEESGRKLESIMVNFTTYISSNDLSSNHLAAVFYTGTAPNQRRRASLEQVVIDGRNANFWSELKQWVVNRAMISFYLAASNKAQDDRYSKKLEQYQKKEVYESWPMLQKMGFPIVYRPMPMPGAIQNLRRPENWATSSAVQAGPTGGSFDVAVSWVDQSRYVSPSVDGNAESQPSFPPKNPTVASGNVLTVDITGLTPPNGAPPIGMLARGFIFPLNATGWNVYVGTHGGPMYLQNATPVPVATKTYQLAADPVLSGVQAGFGQYAEQYISVQYLIQRG
jgi:hypothetical protein